MDEGRIRRVVSFVSALMDSLEQSEHRIIKKILGTLSSSSSCPLRLCGVGRLVMLGIGRFSESYNALVQLAAGLLIARHLDLTRLPRSAEDDCASSGTAVGEQEESLIEGFKVSFFEPLMTETERRICTALGVAVLSENVYGKIVATNPSNNASKPKTLFFMPHCPYRLYCNVLWSNWHP